MDIDGRMPKDLTDRIDRSDMVKVTVREENLLDREAPGPDRVRDLIGRGAPDQSETRVSSQDRYRDRYFQYPVSKLRYA